MKESDFFADAKSFVLRQRPPTPEPKLRRQKYGAELSTQIHSFEKRREEEEREAAAEEKRSRKMLEEDLICEREMFMRRKREDAKKYDEALRTQIMDR